MRNKETGEGPEALTLAGRKRDRPGGQGAFTRGRERLAPARQAGDRGRRRRNAATMRERKGVEGKAEVVAGSLGNKSTPSVDRALQWARCGGCSAEVTRGSARGDCIAFETTAVAMSCTPNAPWMSQGAPRHRPFYAARRGRAKRGTTKGLS